jgi:hypothetical protein
MSFKERRVNNSLSPPPIYSETTSDVFCISEGLVAAPEASILAAAAKYENTNYAN